jgi:hypothetical protein
MGISKKDINEMIENEVQTRVAEKLKPYQSQSIEIAKMKAAVSEKVDKVLQNVKDEILDSLEGQISDMKKAIDVAFDTYWKPKIARKSHTELRQWVINFLNVHAGEIFLTNEIKSQIPMNIVKEYEQDDIDTLIYAMINKPSEDYRVIELDIDNDYVQMLVDSEAISKRHLGVARARSDAKIKFLTSAKAEPKAEYFEDVSLTSKGHKADTSKIPVVDANKNEIIFDDNDDVEDN